MRNYPALRLGAQVFLGAALLSFFSVFQPDLNCLVLCAVLVLAAALAAVRLSKAWLRLLIGLVPAAALLLSGAGWTACAAAGCLVVYAAAVLARGEFCPEPVVYRREAGWTLGLLGLMMLVAILTSRGRTTACLLLCAAFLVLLALQSLLVSASLGPAWGLGNLGALVLVLGLGVGLGLLCRTALPLLLQPLRALFFGLFYLLKYLFDWLFRLVRMTQPEPWDPTEEVLPNVETDKQTRPGSAAPQAPKAVESLRLPELPWAEILTGLAVLILLVLAIVLLRRRGWLRLRRRSPARAAEKAAAEKRGGRRKQSPEPQSNREKVRRLYAGYLDYLRSRGLHLDASDTTEEVTAASAGLLLQTDELLRGLYRKARYSSEEIGDADVRAAEDSFQCLVNQGNLKPK